MSELSHGGRGSAAAPHPALQAYERGEIGLSFGGAGYILLYYVGVVKVLQQLGVVTPHAPPRVAGISAGAITASAVCSGVSADQLHVTVSSLLSTCRKSPCAGRMDVILRELLEATLPHDAPARCKGRFFAGVTVLQNHMPKSVITSVIDGIGNRADMIATLAASAYIPIWSGSRLFTTWRGMETADGSFSAQQPCPPGVAYCLRVSSRSPDVDAPSMATTLQAIGRALVGAQSSAARIKKPFLPERPPFKGSERRQRRLWDKGVDIAPGLSVPSNFDSQTWTELGLIPCDLETCDYLYRLGMLDTMAWAESTGIAAAALRRKQQEGAAPAGGAPGGAPAAGGAAGAATGAAAPPPPAIRMAPPPPWARSALEQLAAPLVSQG